MIDLNESRDTIRQLSAQAVIAMFADVVERVRDSSETTVAEQMKALIELAKLSGVSVTEKADTMVVVDIHMERGEITCEVHGTETTQAVEKQAARALNMDITDVTPKDPAKPVLGPSGALPEPSTAPRTAELDDFDFDDLLAN